MTRLIKSAAPLMISTAPLLALILCLGSFAETAWGSEPDRRPGIIDPPSDVPTGENAALYSAIIPQLDYDAQSDLLDEPVLPSINL